MNCAPLSIPSVSSLYARDFTIQRAVNIGGFALFAAYGIRWATQPVASVVKVEHSPFEIFAMTWGPTIGVAVAALALLILLNRYLWLRRTLCQGITIQGMVEEVDVYEREAPHSDNTPAFQRPVIRSYYANIRYAWQGANKNARLKLPHSPSVYGTFKGCTIDLIVSESSPNRPLIRAVYLDRK